MIASDNEDLLAVFKPKPPKRLHDPAGFYGARWAQPYPDRRVSIVESRKRICGFKILLYMKKVETKIYNSKINTAT